MLVLEFWVRRWITVLTAKEIGSTVLALEMKDIDGKTNVVEERIVSNGAFQVTVVVEENMIGMKTGVVRAFDKFLDIVSATRVS